MTTPLASICIATHNKFPILNRVLQSIYAQDIARTDAVEVVVVDDGSTDLFKNGFVWDQLLDNGGIYKVIDRPPGYRNPSHARNVAAKLARGKVLIMQSDDVVHHTSDTIKRLIDLRHQTVNIASVWNQFPDGSLGAQYTGVQRQLAYFFLGSCLRKDFYTVGGNDEEFTEPGYDDDWLSACLGRGLGLEAVYREDVIGYHQDHPRPASIDASYNRMRALMMEKIRLAETGEGEARFEAASGPWEYLEEDK